MTLEGQKYIDVKQQNSRPWLFKEWIVLLSGSIIITIPWTCTTKALMSNPVILICLVDGTIQTTGVITSRLP